MKIQIKEIRTGQQKSNNPTPIHLFMERHTQHKHTAAQTGGPPTPTQTGDGQQGRGGKEDKNRENKTGEGEREWKKTNSGS